MSNRIKRELEIRRFDLVEDTLYTLRKVLDITETLNDGCFEELQEINRVLMRFKNTISKQEKFTSSCSLKELELIQEITRNDQLHKKNLYCKGDEFYHTDKSLRDRLHQIRVKQDELS